MLVLAVAVFSHTHQAADQPDGHEHVEREVSFECSIPIGNRSASTLLSNVLERARPSGVLDRARYRPDGRFSTCASSIVSI
jgi:hypothetical protein